MPAPLTLPVRYTTRKPPLGTPIHAGHPLAPRGGLGGLWTFQEGAGARAWDSTRLNPVAALSALTWTATPAGRGLSVGSFGTVSVPDCPAQHPTRALTVWCRARIDGGAGTFRTLVCKPATSDWSSPYAVWALRLDSSGHLDFWVNDGGNAADFATSAATYTADGRFHIFAGTYDGATLRAYVDGALVASTAFAAALSTSSLPLRFGTDTATGGGGDNWAGVLDSGGFLGRDLTPGEVRSLYAAPFQMF